LPITEDILYTVRVGDTLDEIGAIFDVSPRCIINLNNLERYSEIEVGAQLLISVSCPRYAEDPSYLPTSTVLIPREVVTTPECENGFPVGPRDTVAGIAAIVGVEEAALRSANELAADAEVLYGMCLQIPATVSDETLGAGGGGDTLPAGTFYIVAFGDSLETIAFDFNVSLQSLMLANNLSEGARLYAGTTLIIPADAPPFGTYPALRPADEDATLGAGGGGDVAGEEYVIQPGDTLDGIALAQNISLQALLMANNLPNGANLLPGTVILLPADAPVYGQFPAMNTLSTTDATLGAGGGGDFVEYVLQPRDTLVDIARTYNVAVEAIKEANGITNAFRLTVGTVILIPKDAEGFREPGTVPSLADSIQPVDSDADPLGN
jgi:LysM repeat protein